MPVRITTGSDGFEEGESGENEKKMLYKVLFDMKGELNDLKRIVLGLMNNKGTISQEDQAIVSKVFSETDNPPSLPVMFEDDSSPVVHDAVEVVSSLSLIDSERELIIKALEKHKNKRKFAAMNWEFREDTLQKN